ncbi:hypothetical protein [Natronobiforma cellulositropha]|uniref:hypothetical protein n=1 Tax=Natronobiforma cellulositropha TaxID=1679076 RepID=UPI0021D5E095|nr:hypothetical protein [Natronobiforma cellulositropha]
MSNNEPRGTDPDRSHASTPRTPARTDGGRGDTCAQLEVIDRCAGRVLESLVGTEAGDAARHLREIRAEVEAARTHLCEGGRGPVVGEVPMVVSRGSRVTTVCGPDPAALEVLGDDRRERE